jgi:hypothetical protein
VKPKTKNWLSLGIEFPFASGTVSRKSLSLAIQSVWTLDRPTETSGPKERPSIFAGMFPAATPFAQIMTVRVIQKGSRENRVFAPLHPKRGTEEFHD